MVDAAVSEKLEAGFQKLQEATNCKSLLKKHLTREIFDKIKDLKTSFGSTLLDVIQSGKFLNNFNLIFFFHSSEMNYIKFIKVLRTWTLDSVSTPRMLKPTAFSMICSNP
jgi:hypothetical protein